MRVEAQWKCDNCGHVGPWTDTWSWYGSIALLDERPADLIHLCSAKCGEEMEGKITRGEVEQPVCHIKGYHAKITGKRRGY